MKFYIKQIDIFKWGVFFDKVHPQTRVAIVMYKDVAIGRAKQIAKLHKCKQYKIIEV